MIKANEPKGYDLIIFNEPMSHEEGAVHVSKWFSVLTKHLNSDLETYVGALKKSIIQSGFDRDRLFYNSLAIQAFLRVLERHIDSSNQDLLINDAIDQLLPNN